MKPLNLTGMRFGRLLVLDRDGSRNGKSLWNCRCDCGATVNVVAPSLQRGVTLSCGCRRSESARRVGFLVAAPNKKPTPTANTYRSMLDRCENPHSTKYRRYGGRGVSICAHWRESYQNFVADMGERPTGTTLDRIDNDGNYEPTNCRWATPQQQGRNKSTNVWFEHGGETLTISEWAQRLGMARRSLRDRIESGWPLALALSVPPVRNRERGADGAFVADAANGTNP